MLLFEESTEQNTDAFRHFSAAPEQVLFFDIETTGFSADSSYVYLIGCAYLKENKVCLRQMLMEEASEEKKLVSSFLSFALSFQALVHYNGAAFDIPFLQKKCIRHRLKDSFASLTSIDLYKQLQPIKKLLGLTNLKQKTVEQYLGIYRRDSFSGGDLIPVYTEFIARYRYEQLTASADTACPDFTETGLPKLPCSPANALMQVLLLHNREDIRGLLAISSIQTLHSLLNGEFSWQGPFSVSEKNTSLSQAYPLNAPGQLVFVIQPDKPCPVLSALLDTPRKIDFTSACSALLSLEPMECPTVITDSSDITAAADRNESCNTGFSACSGSHQRHNSMILTLPLIHGSFKYFFDDYKDYYYLPLEDRAIHKSVAEFVDRAFRKKATRETCYQKKEGLFLPQPRDIYSPAFREGSKIRHSFFTPDDYFLSDQTKLKEWLISIITEFFQ